MADVTDQKHDWTLVIKEPEIAWSEQNPAFLFPYFKGVELTHVRRCSVDQGVDMGTVITIEIVLPQMGVGELITKHIAEKIDERRP